MTSSAVRSRPSTKTRSENRMLLWVSMTSLGLPVVPEVESRHATWSDSTGTFSARGSVVATISATVGRSVCLGAFLSTSAMTFKRGDVVGDVEDLLLVIDAVEGGGPDVGAALHEVHGVGEVGPVEVAGERLDDGAGLEAGHVGDGELGPVRELQGDHVAGLYALGHEPRSQAARCVVHFPVVSCGSPGRRRRIPCRRSPAPGAPRRRGWCRRVQYPFS